MKNEITHDTDLSLPGQQAFNIILWEAPEEEMWEAAQQAALEEIGCSNHTTFYSDLTSYQRTKYNAAERMTAKMEVIREAYRTPEIVWLAQQDCRFELFPHGWCYGVEAPELTLVIADDGIAALFKLTFAGE